MGCGWICDRKLSQKVISNCRVNWLGCEGTERTSAEWKSGSGQKWAGSTYVGFGTRARAWFSFLSKPAVITASPHHRITITNNNSFGQLYLYRHS